MDDFIDDSMTKMYIYEVSQMLTKIEKILIASDLDGFLSSDNILILFRLMHTLKSSSSAMGFKESSNLAHKFEDLLKYVEKSKNDIKDFATISEISLACVDYFRLHIHKIKNNETSEDDSTYLIERIDTYFDELNKKDNNESPTLPIENSGLNDEVNEINQSDDSSNKDANKSQKNSISTTKIDTDSIISVRTDRLDALMNLVGEIVITEPLVTESKEIVKNNCSLLAINSMRLHKMVVELQDIVMSIRMITLSSLMVKMNRILHDMNKQFNKSVELEVIGEDTEVDKNVIDLISDPLMHIFRNALDHGIENKQERIDLNKSPNGKIILEARNIGSNVLISVIDDGRGLNSKAIYDTAKKMGIAKKTFKNTSQKEIYSYIMEPGFTTNKEVTDYSGRGVGMDVVKKNIYTLGGSIDIESKENVGTTIALKIPLVLSIVDVLNININSTYFSIPISYVVETFRISDATFVTGSNDDQLIKIRDNLYPLLDFSKVFSLDSVDMDKKRGVIILIKTEGEKFCIYCDEVLGQYSVVAKAIPDYLLKYRQIDAIAGCTIMRDGKISLILDCYSIIKFLKKEKEVKSGKL